MLSFAICFDDDKQKYKLYCIHRFYSNTKETPDLKNYEIVNTIGYYETYEEAVNGYMKKIGDAFKCIDKSN